MTEINDLERRITTALERIGRGVDRLREVAAVPVNPAPEGRAALAAPVAPDELARLQVALDDEKTVNLQLTERLRATKERGSNAGIEAVARIEALTRQLDIQGLEMQRLRKATTQLHEQLRTLRETATDGVADPHLINRAMLAELEAMRTTRASETAEIDEILAELAPLLPPGGHSSTEVQPDA